METTVEGSGFRASFVLEKTWWNCTGNPIVSPLRPPKYKYDYN